MKTKKQVSNILGVLWADETTITLYLSDGEANILGRGGGGAGGGGGLVGSWSVKNFKTALYRSRCLKPPWWFVHITT